MSRGRTRILVVEDDASTSEVMAASLGKEGYDAVVEANGARALERWRDDGDFDLVILDIVLPGMDGLTICRTIRETSEVPILMLTGKVDTSSVVAGLEMGADDYMRKPFDLIELKARVRSLLRRTHAADEDGSLTVGALVIDVQAGRVSRSGSEISLSATELKLLVELARAAGKVLSRRTLLARVWDYDYLGDSRLVDMAVKRLRAKIEDDPAAPRLITTVRGLGYRLDAV